MKHNLDNGLRHESSSPMKFVFAILSVFGFCAISPAFAQDADAPPSDGTQTQTTTTAYTVGFSPAKAEISADTMQILWEAGHSDLALQQGVIRISGYTDSKGSAAYNQKLSLRRAEAVAAQLVKIGLDRSRMVVAGFGSQTAETGVANTQDNRRVDIVFESGVAIAAPREIALSVNFDNNTASINASEFEKLSVACQSAAARHGAVRISGYADAKGLADYNRKLSERRAQAVAAALAQCGLDRSHMTVKGFGSVAHENNLSSGNDRRVDIVIETSAPDRP